MLREQPAHGTAGKYAYMRENMRYESCRRAIASVLVPQPRPADTVPQPIVLLPIGGLEQNQSEPSI